jgi:hypothetical protein
MSDIRLTKKEAFELISAVVDKEVDEKTEAAFYNYIETDPQIRSEYKSVKRIKQLVSDRCPTENAPDHLKEQIQDYLKQEVKHNTQVSPKDKNQISEIDMPADMPGSKADDTKSDSKKTDGSFRWIYAAAASFLVVAILWGIFYRSAPTTDQMAANSYQVEEYVYKHFENNDGKLIPPNIRTASLSDAELSISTNYNMSMEVPALKNSEFMGVAYSEFVPDFKTPLLEYYLPEEDQYIYIFAFPVDNLNQFGKLNRDEEAVKSCIKPTDFYVENVNGKHVVSWHWDNVWYAAISNHNGEVLASLVENLQYEVETDTDN